MIPVGHKINYNKPKHKPYDCANCTYKKYGQEIKIRDFVNEGRENTEAKKIIGKTISIDELKRMCKEIPEQKAVLDMNINPYMANKLMKTSKIAYDKIMAQKAAAEAAAEAAKKEAKEENVNE